MTDKKERWILFDLDGTLVDSLPSLYEAYCRFLRGHQVVPSRSEFDAFNGPSVPEIVACLRKRHHLTGRIQQLTDDYIRSVREVSGKNRLDRSGVRLIRNLKRTFSVGLVTSCVPALAKPYLEKKKLRGLFDSVTFGDEAVRGKPDPALYRRAMQKSGADPLRTLVVEDAPNGVLSAKEAGAYVIGFARRGGAKALKMAGADRVVGDFGRLEGILVRGRGVEASCRTLFRGSHITVHWKKSQRTGADSIFCIKKMTNNKNRVDVSGDFKSYKSFVAGVSDKKKSAPLLALAVSGLTIMTAKEKKYYLIGLRSQQVSSYKGRWELVPSGGIDVESLDARRRIDFVRKLKQELSEESGIPASSVRSVKTLCLLRDMAGNTCDIVGVIRLKTGRVRLAYDTKEYRRMRFIDEASMHRFLDHEGRLVPSARVIWRNYTNQNELKGNL